MWPLEMSNRPFCGSFPDDMFAATPLDNCLVLNLERPAFVSSSMLEPIASRRLYPKAFGSRFARKEVTTAAWSLPASRTRDAIAFSPRRSTYDPMEQIMSSTSHRMKMVCCRCSRWSWHTSSKAALHAIWASMCSWRMTPVLASYSELTREWTSSRMMSTVRPLISSCSLAHSAGQHTRYGVRHELWGLWPQRHGDAVPRGKTHRACERAGLPNTSRTGRFLLVVRASMRPAAANTKLHRQ